MMQRNLPKMWCMFRGFVCLLNLIALALSWLLKLASSITTQNNLFFRGVWLSFPYILKIACMTSTHWPDQHFHLLSFLAHPNNEQVAEWSNQNFCRPGPTGLWDGYTPVLDMQQFIMLKNQWFDRKHTTKTMLTFVLQWRVIPLGQKPSITHLFLKGDGSGL